MENLKSYDVIIAGGGISGAIAGIAAAREGVKTLIIEQGGFLGGSLTSNGVGPMMTFHAGPKQVIKGIVDEVIENLKAKGKSPGHVRDATNYVYTVTPFDAEALKVELESLFVEAGGTILYHTFIAGVNMIDNKIVSLKVANKAGLVDIPGKVFIDATADGDIAAWSKVPFTKGRESDGASQPLTMKMKYNNVDREKLIQHIKENINEFERINKDPKVLDEASRLSVIGFEKEFKEAKEKGEISIRREDVLFFETNVQGEFIINTTRILNKDATDPFSLSEAEIEGRKQAEELDYFLRKYVPGFESASLMYTGPRVGIRGSRQIIGTYTLTAEDLLESKTFEDTVAHSGYPIDIHSPDGEGTNSIHLKPDQYYEIPYSIMTTNEVKNLIVTGRCVSATFEAQAAIRTTPTVGALGQASGVAASLAVKNDSDVKGIDIKNLQNILKKQGAYLEK